MRATCKGAYDYRYTYLGWDATKQHLVIIITGAPGPGPDPGPVNPVRGGIGAITGSSHIAAFNPAFSAFADHSKGLFAALWQESDNGQVLAGGSSADSGQNLNRLWVTPTYSFTKQSGSGNVGYDLKTPGIALGFDRMFSENLFAGFGVSLSWPDYEDDDTDIDASDITFALYGGVRLPYALELDGRIGYGFTRYDQDRRAEGERYSDKYDGRSFFAGLGLGRPFALGDGFSLRPAVGYDYIHIDTDGYDEGAGTYALETDDYSLSLHRLKAGMDLGWQAENGLTVNGEVYYLGLYGDRHAEVSSHFVNDPVNGFTAVGNGLDENSLGLGLNVSFPVSEQWELGAGYNVLFGKDATSQQGMLKAVFRF